MTQTFPSYCIPVSPTKEKSVFCVFLLRLQLHGYRGKEPLGLQIFIGTADERILKPHAFYQVHRITGKTVTTTSFEKIIHGTKVLEIPLEPKNNMKAMCEYINILMCI